MGARLHIIHIHVTYVKTIYYTDCDAGRGQCEALVGASDVDRYIYTSRVGCTGYFTIYVCRYIKR